MKVPFLLLIQQMAHRVPYFKAPAALRCLVLERVVLFCENKAHPSTNYNFFDEQYASDGEWRKNVGEGGQNPKAKSQG